MKDRTKTSLETDGALDSFWLLRLRGPNFGPRTMNTQWGNLFTAGPKIKSQFQIYRYGRSIFFLPHSFSKYRKILFSSLEVLPHDFCKLQPPKLEMVDMYHKLRNPMKAYIKETWNLGPMWQRKNVLAVPINLELGFDFSPCREGNFLIRCP